MSIQQLPVVEKVGGGREAGRARSGRVRRSRACSTSPRPRRPTAADAAPPLTTLRIGVGTPATSRGC
ncbi:hypothetical protein [Streptomyces xantholiticus]|uniref:Uncharacterized protein n=1 Tax=Streptomyces xantholiticus TaxID=68285 RepID=A0ABV1UN02_9ACTN